MMDPVVSGGTAPPPNVAPEQIGRIVAGLAEASSQAQRLQDGKALLEQQRAEQKRAEEARAPARKETTVKEVRNAWLQKSLADWVDQVEGALLNLLLRWEPGPGTLDENLGRLLQGLAQSSRQLAAQGQSLLAGGALEDALLSALARLFTQQAGGFLQLSAPTASQGELEQLLNGLYTRLTGENASKEGLSTAADGLRQGLSGAPSGVRPGQNAPEGGVIYRRAATGIRIEGGALGASRRAPYEIHPERPSPAGMALSGRAVRYAERYANFLQALEPIPPKELPFTSEERLGLELGMISLHGALAAARPELGSPLPAMIRCATEAYVKTYLAQAEKELGRYAVQHPPVSACPAFRLDSVLEICQYVLASYQQLRDPELAVGQALRYALSRFQKKKEEPPYRSWLRYHMEQGFFALQPEPRADLKRGWERICKRWNKFLQTMEFTGARFRASAWALIATPPTGGASSARASLPTAGRWVLACAGAAIALAALLPGLGGVARSGCLAIGAVVLAASFVRL